MAGFLIATWIEFLLCGLLATIISLWVILFAISIRSHLLTPVICASGEGQYKTSLAFMLQYIKLDKQFIKYNITASHDVFDRNFKVANTSDVKISVPLVSVIVPARNEEENIKSCLESLLSQTYSNFEIIVIDDNSTDNTLKIVKQIKKTLTPTDKLKIISLREKPDKWTGKTWASQQGYLKSSGDLLLFTDADTYYGSKDAISLSVLYMQNEDLDVLTGVPFLRLQDFWSKIVMPVWMLFTELFKMGIADVNDPKSNVAYLMGSFFIIKRSVFEKIGTFECVSEEIQEDRALGIRIKTNGYKIKMVKMDRIISALFSRDVSTLWNSIKRTIAPVAIKSRPQIIINLLTIFFMTLLPFIVLLFTLTSIIVVMVKQQFYTFDITQFYYYHQDPLALLLFLNICSCLIVVTGTAIKSMKRYRLAPTYSIFAFIGSVFLIVGYIGGIAPLLSSKKIQSIEWRGRKHNICY